jgi:lipopolysaccharide transport system ATP-binding protein
MPSADLAISVRDLGKQYVIYHDHVRTTTLAEAVASKIRSPLKRRQREVFWALRDVSFDVQRGDVVGVLGRNGAGKSTLLKILSRITTPSTGCVELFGRVGSLLEVGTGFHSELTGRENVYLNGSILGMSRREIDGQFDAIVDFSGVEKFLDTPVKRYSSGMYVRLAFAVAAHLNPEILIVDEVLSVGDAEFQKKCLGKMKDVAGSGRTVLLVSHNLPTVRSLCKSAILLVEGKVAAAGEAQGVIDQYIQSGAQANCVDADLASRRRTAGATSDLRITRIVLNNGEPILHGEPFQADIFYESARAYEDVAFGIGIHSMDGVRILSIDTDIPGDRFAIAANTRGKVRMAIDELHLEPDRYRLDLGVRSGDYHGLDYVNDAAMIDVLPGPKTPPVISLRTSGRGGWRNPTSHIEHQVFPASEVRHAGTVR